MSVMESGCLWGDGPRCCASLALGTSCGKSSNQFMKYKKNSRSMFVCSHSISPRYFYFYLRCIIICLHVKMDLKGKKIIVFHP